MTRIETTAVVGEDRTITVRLPDTVPPGEHAVVVLVNGTPAENDVAASADRSANQTGELCWEDGVLVWTGQLPPDFDIVKQIQEDRDARTSHLWYGSDHEGAP